jgi:hypothetical protein
MPPRVTIAVDVAVWHACKCAAAELDISILELLGRIARGEDEPLAWWRRKYDEAEALNKRGQEG